VMWVGLSEGEQGELQRRHREQYYALSGYLYNEDQKNPYFARAIVQRELPNLMVAVRGALAAGEEWAVEFVEAVSKFLHYFGMSADMTDLTNRAATLAQSGAVGSQAWYLALSNVGEQLYQLGKPQAAIVIFQEILVGLCETVSYERCVILLRLGRCWKAMGQPAQAAKLHRQALEGLAQLEPSDGVKRQMGATQTDLGDVLKRMGDYGAARMAYEASLVISKEMDDERGVAVCNGQLGTLAMNEGNLAEAETRHQLALATFRILNEPAQEAVAWHQLGMVYQEAKAWEQAEQAYRAAARLWDEQGNLAGAAKTWNQLASVCQNSGKPKEAEAWFRKTIETSKAVGDIVQISRSLGNLANLLQTQGNFPEARQLAEETIDLMKTLDASAEIWKTYNLLADIATQQGEAAKAKDYRRQARQSYAAFAGSRQVLQQWEEMIAGMTIAVGDVEARSALEEVLSSLVERGYGDLVAGIRRIWAGERDEDELCDELDREDSLIVGEILRRLAV
jgi:tetratricopeptide (TPR) repeat protein